jgi:hypothetical protein
MIPAFKIASHPSLLINPVYQVCFNPGRWLQAGIKDMVDCYAYSLNIPEIGPAALGCLSAHENGTAPAPESIQAVKKLLARDQLIELATLPEDSSHVIAVFHSPRVSGGRPGILCYRRDMSGWSYLYNEGDCSFGGAPSQHDFSGNLIRDPLQCNRGPYTDFVGYWAIPYDGIMIRPKLDVGRAAPCPGF